MDETGIIRMNKSLWYKRLRKVSLDGDKGAPNPEGAPTAFATARAIE